MKKMSTNMDNIQNYYKNGKTVKPNSLAPLELRKNHAKQLQNIQDHYETELQRLKEELVRLQNLMLSTPSKAIAAKNNQSNIFNVKNNNIYSSQRQKELQAEVSRLSQCCAELERKLNKSKMEMKLLNMRCAQMKLEKRKQENNASRYKEMLQSSYSERRKLEEDFLKFKQLETEWQQQLQDASSRIEQLKQELESSHAKCGEKENEIVQLRMKNSDLQETLGNAFTRITALQDLVIQSKTDQIAAQNLMIQKTEEAQSMSKGMNSLESNGLCMANSRRQWLVDKNNKLNLQIESDIESLTSSMAYNSSQYDTDLESTRGSTAMMNNRRNNQESDRWSLYSSTSTYSRQSSDESRQTEDDKGRLQNEISEKDRVLIEDTDSVFDFPKRFSQGSLSSPFKNRSANASILSSPERGVRSSNESHINSCEKLGSQYSGNNETDISKLQADFTKLTAEKSQIEYRLQRIPTGKSSRKNRHSFLEQEMLEDRLSEVTKNIGSIKRSLKENKA